MRLRSVYAVEAVKSEAAALEALKDLPFSVDFHGLQLPSDAETQGNAYLIMG